MRRPIPRRRERCLWRRRWSEIQRGYRREPDDHQVPGRLRARAHLHLLQQCSDQEGVLQYDRFGGLYDCRYKPIAGERGLFKVRVSAYKDTSGNAGRAGSYNTWGYTVDPRAPAAPKLALKNPSSSPGGVARPTFTATLSEPGGQLHVRSGGTLAAERDSTSARASVNRVRGGGRHRHHPALHG